MSEEQESPILLLLTDFGNANYDCGQWTGDDGSSYDPVKAHHDETKQRITEAIAALESEMSSLREENATLREKAQEQWDLRIESNGYWDKKYEETAERLERAEAALREVRKFASGFAREFADSYFKAAAKAETEEGVM